VNGLVRDLSARFFNLSLLIVIPPLRHPFTCATALTTQHIVTFSVFEFGALSLILHMADYEVKNLVL
jgi:hypothetical protein